MIGGSFKTLAGAALVALLAAGCSGKGDSPEQPTASKPGDKNTAAPKLGQKSGPPRAETGSRKQAAGAYDVRPLLNPERDYFGAFQETPRQPAQQVASVKKLLGHAPNILKRYYVWNAPFERSWAQETWAAGAVPQVEWEPFDTSLASIAAGKSDAYIKQYAKDVRALNVPVAISFAHEFNGWWYPWADPKKVKPGTTPATYVKAWRRLHTLFTQAGATNAIWLWTPNEIGRAHV